MSRLPLRARVAPLALLIVFGFVVIGFFKADSDMVRAEHDRATSIASQSAARLEAFLFRHEAWLRNAQLVNHRALGTTSMPSTPSMLVPPSLSALGGAKVTFDKVLVLDSAGVVQSTIALPSNVLSPSVDASLLEMSPAMPTQQLAGTLGRKLSSSILLGPHVGGARQLYFAVPSVVPTAPALVGIMPVDSLAASLHTTQTAMPLGWIVQSGSDTLIQELSGHTAGRMKSVRALVDTPFAQEWTLTMLYSPSGRGVRIALWIVGVGAVVGLGIGLLLERREAARIADRSSELEHLSTELLRANRAKSEFLANVSHELRTPLNAIVGFVDLLRDGVYGALNARQVGPVERIEASANHLRHLVDQVLDLAKMAAGRLEVHTEPVELRPFVFDVASEVEPLITEKGLHFSLTVGATLPRVRTDPTHLRQILINLLGNAVKFTNSGGISIRGKLVGTETRSGLPSVLNAATSLLMRSPRPDGLWIALQVVDSGIGIGEKDRERIFDEFEQVNAGPRGDSMRRGTGLGLSISRRLARLIGGDITVESELGRGSVFTIWLPVDPADLRGDRAA